MEYVWYLSYGSNMYKERFLCYITGSKYKDCKNIEQGCRDNALPLDERNIIIENELFFTFQAGKWQNMGVSFISKQKVANAKTYAKMYLITKEQFEDVVKQENRLDVDENLAIDYNLLNETGQLNLFEETWYGSLLKIDEVEGIPIYTFTLPQEVTGYTKPSIEYLTSILTGIKLNYGEITEVMLDNFMDLKGIKGNYETHELIKIVDTIVV